MDVDPDQLLRAVCPDGATITSHPSSRIIGTAYGNWLGRQYIAELQKQAKPSTYAVVDFEVFTGSTSWEPGNIWSLAAYDPLVGTALTVTEWTRGWRQRTDILNSDTDEIFEIKPIRSRAEGPEQLQGYITTLQAMAPWTTIGPPRPRAWHGGTWDPTRYPLVVPGFGGKRVCVLHAWMDSQVQGLIVYDIKCCSAPDSQRPELQPTRVAHVVTEIEPQMRPALEELVLQALPLGEAGSSYAVLASEQFFELFVKPGWDRKMDAIHEKYGPQPGPVFRKFMLETLLLQDILTMGNGTELLVALGYVPKELANQLHGARIVALAATAATVIVTVAAIEIGAAAGAWWAAGAGFTPAVTAELAAGTAVAANAVPRVATQLPRVAPSLLNGSSRLLQVGPSVTQRAVGSGVIPGMGAGSSGPGLGVLGALAYFVLPADAAAAPAGSPERQAQFGGAELMLLAPVELLQPVGGATISAGSFVRCAGEKYFVPALVRADAA